jgi:hypothetical protein
LSLLLVLLMLPSCPLLLQALPRVDADYRLAKEVTSDIQESEDRQKDLDRIRDSGADGADIRNAVSYPFRLPYPFPHSANSTDSSRGDRLMIRREC